MKTKPILKERFALYEASVQSVEFDVEFIDRIYRKRRGKPALELREDFCGTFSLCCEWVKSRRDRHALGVDLSAPTLAYGRENHLKKLAKDAQNRVEIARRNVIIPSRPVDLIVAQNFSYFTFKTRAEMLRYFKGCRASLKKDGLFCLDIFGGPETEDPQVDRHRIRPKGYAPFEYFWELRTFNPIDRRADYRIHFRLANGRWVRDAFMYDWRMWTIPEVRELLAEAGFKQTELLWEEDNGAYRPKKVAENEPAWLGYLVSSI